MSVFVLVTLSRSEYWREWTDVERQESALETERKCCTVKAAWCQVQLQRKQHRDSREECNAERIGSER